MPYFLFHVLHLQCPNKISLSQNLSIRYNQTLNIIYIISTSSFRDFYVILRYGQIIIYIGEINIILLSQLCEVKLDLNSTFII